MTRRHFAARRSTSTTKPTRRLLRLEALEDRLSPVIGAFDVPSALGAGSGYDGVARLRIATGALLSTARHVLSAAHVAGNGSTAASTFVVEGPNGPVTIATPGAGFIRHPNYPGGQPDDFDIGVMPLAELGPLTAERWEIDTGGDETGDVGRLVGYGGTGTGTIGHSTDVNDNQYWSTSNGQQTSYEVIRLRIVGNPTSGFFTVRTGNSAPQVVSFNATIDNLTDAFNALPNIGNVLVRRVGDTNFDSDITDLTDNPDNPRAGAFEVLFRGTSAANHSVADISVQSFLQGGNNPQVLLQKLLNGGDPRIKTTGLQQIGRISANGARLYADFDDGTTATDSLEDGLGQGANEGKGTWGDSGSPLFINGKIVGVLEGLYNGVEDGYASVGYDSLGGSGDFGEIMSWASTSYNANFLNGVLSTPLPLVLNMKTQSLGDDQLDDTVTLSRVGNQFQIRFNGELVYSESLNLITSITVLGSGDNETFILSNLDVGVPVSIRGGSGQDTITVTGATPDDLTINGGNQDDTINIRDLSSGTETTVEGTNGHDVVNVGTGNLNAEIRGKLYTSGGVKNIDVHIDDTAGPNGSQYFFTTYAMSKPGMGDGFVGFNAVRTVTLETGSGEDNVFLDRAQAGVKYVINTGADDDFVRVGDGDIAQFIEGQVELHGWFGNDTLAFRDWDSATINPTYTLGTGTFKVTGQAATLKHAFFDTIRILGTAQNDTINVQGIDPGVELQVFGYGGADTLNLSVVPPDVVTFNGGPGADTANLIGTNGADEFVLMGTTLDYVNAGEVRFPNVETVNLDGKADSDLLKFEGTAGTFEDVHVIASAQPKSGRMEVNGPVQVAFVNTEQVAANGNPADGDRLSFHGTAADDDFFVRLEAAGTQADPLVKLRHGNSPVLLALRDYSGFDRLNLLGEDGADDFTVYVGPSAPVSRNLHVNGGRGLPGVNDALRVYYDDLPGVIASDTPSPAAPKSGVVTVQYPPRRFFDISYEEIEDVDLIGV